MRKTAPKPVGNNTLPPCMVLDMIAADDALVGHAYRKAGEIASQKGYSESGFRIVQNNGAGAGQSVFHIHFHLLAGREFTWPPG